MLLESNSSRGTISVFVEQNNKGYSVANVGGVAMLGPPFLTYNTHKTHRIQNIFTETHRLQFMTIQCQLSPLESSNPPRWSESLTFRTPFQKAHWVLYGPSQCTPRPLGKCPAASDIPGRIPARKHPDTRRGQLKGLRVL